MHLGRVVVCHPRQSRRRRESRAHSPLPPGARTLPPLPSELTAENSSHG